MIQKYSTISSINLVMTLAKRKSIVFSIRPCLFRLSTNIIMWTNKSQQSIFYQTNISIFHSISTLSTSKWSLPINFMTPEDSPRKTASSDVKISEKNDTWLIQLFQTKSATTHFFMFIIGYTKTLCTFVFHYLI